MKKLVYSMVRTIISMGMLFAGIFIEVQALHWTAWCPNNEVGFCMVVAMHAFAFVAMAYGLYGVSPINATALWALFMGKITGNRNFLNDAKRRIRVLRKWYLW